MRTIRTFSATLLALASLVVFSSCGGGSGGGGGNSNLPPITYSIMGIVSGAPQGTTVTLTGGATATTTTNSIGYYQFSGLSNGTYTVTPSMSGYTLSPASQPVTISSANAVNKNFAVVFGIAGTVLSGGVSLSGVTITLVNSSGTSTTRTTDANGNYSALGLDAGTYTISAGHTGYSMNPLNQKATTACEVATGIDFTATAAATTYSILGTVTTSTGSGFPNVTVTLSGANTGLVFTGADGTYAISGLLDGAYTVMPSKRAGTTIYHFTPVSSPTIKISGSDSIGNNFAHSSTQFTAPPICLQSTVSGIVSGASISGVTMDILVLSSTVTSTTTDSGGFFSLRTTASGTYALSPSMVGNSFSPPRICGSVTCPVAAILTGNNFTSQ